MDKMLRNLFECVQGWWPECKAEARSSKVGALPEAEPTR